MREELPPHQAVTSLTGARLAARKLVQVPEHAGGQVAPVHLKARNRYRLPRLDAREGRLRKLHPGPAITGPAGFGPMVQPLITEADCPAEHRDGPRGDAGEPGCRRPSPTAADMALT